MIQEYSQLLERAKNDLASTKKFLKLPLLQRVPGFYKIVHEIHAEVFSRIDCTKCGNCCRALGPRVNETDIKRIAPLFRMKAVAFVKEYLRVDEDDDFVFKDMPCPFLGDDNICSVYDERPKACRDYPHTGDKNIQSKLHLLATNTTYCPAAVLIVDELKKKFG